MEKLIVGTLLLTVLSGGISQSDMDGKAFIFPQESSTAYVSLIPRVKKSLQNFTLCLKAFTDLTRPYSIFSYNTKTQDNEILLFVQNSGEYMFYVGNSAAIFKAPTSLYDPVHICVNWESASGIAEFWLNGKPLGRKGLKKGYTVGGEAKIIIGQEQDSFGGNFDAKQSFVGEIWDVSLWDHVIPLEEAHDSCDGGNLINFRALTYEENGYVVTKPKLWT
ncbi:mucosal pentraxin [Rattus norvegicus]|uniref:Mucosal pentraxin n=2 Tax=Rattus norvegicus TaxID=10116 RepID=MPTX_RAT|nr:mucosal pentraxin precursor [Rattus norvegicus]Q6TA48.1 RecName: Full=Mucosal pentraxin; Flags: Precursor [Rattus norvegicus]AAR04681.1 mucosal pentraxin [Rattus norvegicus]EDL94739.1 mucosal pentraxin [Rattus norvegicus]|eukprot:NP_001032731.1 mucosal pentraxin precursor [Rattus norvegicus]